MKGNLGMLGWAVAIGALAWIVVSRHDPMFTRATTNPKVPVALLFEHEGCRVFRFEDDGYSRYYVRCLDGFAQTMAVHEQEHGTQQPETISTIQEGWDADAEKTERDLE